MIGRCAVETVAYSNLASSPPRPFSTRLPLRPLIVLHPLSLSLSLSFSTHLALSPSGFLNSVRLQATVAISLVIREGDLR